MAKGDKFGSPFDPRNMGKVQREQVQREQERREQERRQEEQRQHQLRGCGNPDCPMCNPETAGMGLGSRPIFGYGRPTSEAFMRTSDAMRDSILSSFEMEMTRSVFAGLGSEPPRAAAAPAGPPASYKEAREEVEKWIVPAPEQAFDDIVGNEAALEQLRDAIQAPVKHKALYEAYGMKMPKGAMLSGPPGCGKTMFARAAASEMRRLYGKGSEFISISGSELQSMFIGETEARVKAIFTFAREYKAFHKHPLLVFMDEAEVLLPDRTGRVRRVASWEESQVATFLAEMDGMQESGAFVLLATNRPEVIDQAVLRDGRCDFKIIVQRPTREALEIILRKNLDGILLADGCSADDLTFAAVESFYDPHKVILEAHLLGIDWEREKIHTRDKHFLFEHIVSGAMAASIAARAKRRAFARDKADGVARGVTVDDVVQSVQGLFEENKGLEHAFAQEEFKRQFMAEAKASILQERTPPPPARRAA